MYTRAAITTMLLMMMISLTGCDSPDEQSAPVCIGECDRWQSCTGDDMDACVEGCINELSSSSGSCHDGLVDLKICVGSLDCTELEQYWDADPTSSTPYPCHSEYNTVLLRCD